VVIQVTPEARPALRSAFGPRLAGLPRLLRAGAIAALERGRVRNASLEITLVDDAAIAALNERYLEHAGPTDVIAFPLHSPGEQPEGDVYIGAEQAARQADQLGVELSEELVRLAVHGTLHVLGLDHADGDARTQGEMWALQESIVAEVCGP